jgi:shikimate dehydrogenase
MIKSCVIGHPISHSRSPLIHGAWLKEYAIAGQYVREDVSPEALPQFFQRLRAGEFCGCNVTLPHKETAIAYVDVTDDHVRKSGSLNTIYVRDNVLHATSTDGEGFAANVLWHEPGFQFVGSKVLLLGAGGSARALADEVLRRGATQVVIANRTVQKAAQIAEAFGQGVSAIALQAMPLHLPHMNLVINTTSAGISDNGRVECNFRMLPRTAVVADINYVPLVTPFLLEAKVAGLKIVPGLGMLLHQAVRGFELWFGCRPAVTRDLHNLVARDIDPTWMADKES